MAGEFRLLPSSGESSRQRFVASDLGAIDKIRARRQRVAPAATEERNSFLKYRSDIDGLRALSILAVVAYHLFPEWVTGGFVGVDVFFVISGFLISTIIFRSLHKNNFSFIEFYAHRVRRIFPALVIVMAFCVALGWNVLLPSEFQYLAEHIIASAAFVQNIILSRESGYFDIASELKPLNHLWSLAIEEQFYAVFPLLMWGAWRLRFGPLTLVTAICGTSLAVSVFGVHHNATGAFFSLGSRAWELMAGALLAGAMLDSAADNPLMFAAASDTKPNPKFFGKLLMQWAGRLPSRQSLVQSVLSIIGFALILYAAFAFDGQTPYPGWHALVPVLGGVLVIFSGTTACINRFLSNPVAIFIGLISYPLYLWHWPLLSYLTIIDNASPPLYQRSLVAILSIFLAWLTYQFVERPIRENKLFWKRAANCLIASMALMMIFGFNATHFYPDYDPQTSKIIQAWNFQGYAATPGLYVDERYGFEAVGHNEDNRILFYGESHVFQYRNVIAKLVMADRPNQSEDGEALSPPFEALFPPFTDFLPSFTSELTKDKTISSVVFSYFWALQYDNGKVNGTVRCCGNGLNGMIGGRRSGGKTVQQMNEFDRRWVDIANSWKQAGKQVYFVLDNPFGEELAPQFLVRRTLFHRVQIAVVPLSKTAAIERDEPVRSRLLKIAQDTDSKIIDPFQYLCAEDTCPALSSEGMPIYRDYDHLSEDTLMNVHYLDRLLTPKSADGNATVVR
jgi:peptidoglycan/LPS O-acetylase OafA/YrhL